MNDPDSYGRKETRRSFLIKNGHICIRSWYLPNREEMSGEREIEIKLLKEVEFA